MTGNGLILGLILGSALRSLLLGAFVFTLLKLARLRDLRTETTIWTVVLLVALAMPALSLWSPDGLAITLPRLAAFPRPPLLLAAAALHGAQALSPDVAARLLVWAGAHMTQLLWGLYCLVALASLARLATGLVLTLALYRAAEPVAEDWARGRNIRASAAIAGPLSFANCILLPADHQDWSDAKRLAVLAHEESHIRRGDFFIQLLASAHRALFWFSPFAWWLQLRLGELAETASDQAAIRRINDAAGYAEILVEVARKAHRLEATVAMARSPGVARRVDHILSGATDKSLGTVGRIATLSVVLAVSLAFAQVHAAIATAPANPAPLPILWAVAGSPVPATTRAPAPHALVHAIHAAASRNPATAGVKATQAEADFTYNPRALLDDPDTVLLPTPVSTGRGVDKTSAQAGAMLDAVAGFDR
jgi:beta-lactamase regulating signal transducer with metallopeptidase domain